MECSGKIHSMKPKEFQIPLELRKNKIERNLPSPKEEGYNIHILYSKRKTRIYP